VSTGLVLRRALPGDASAIAAIYNAEVLNSTATFDLVARSEEEQREWMGAHEGAYPLIVAEGERGLRGPGPGMVVGFGSLSPYRTRPAYATTVEDSVYVGASHRHQGAGGQILAELVRLARAHGFHTVIGRVAAENTASIGLHQACGFVVAGVEREIGRKFGRWLDVAILQLLL